MTALKIRKSKKFERTAFWVIDIIEDDKGVGYITPDGSWGEYTDYPSKLRALDAARLSRYFCQDDLETDTGKKKTNPKGGHPDFYKLLEQMADLHSRKNHDYAGTKDPLKNLRACERLNLEPFLGVLVRLQDKWSRLEEFVNSKQLMVKNESVIDTLMDNAVYSLLAIILYQEQQERSKISGKIK